MTIFTGTSANTWTYIRKIKEVLDYQEAKLLPKPIAKRNISKHLDWNFTPFQEASCLVKCSKTMHRIGVTKKGQLVFFHPKDDFDANMALRSLGSRHRCRCMTVRKNWLRYVTGEAPTLFSVPPELQLEMHRAKRRHNRRSRRRTKNRTNYEDQLAIPFTRRASALAKIVRRELERSALFLGPMASKMEFIPTKLILRVSNTDRTVNQLINKTTITIALPPLTWPATAPPPSDSDRGFINAGGTLSLPHDWYEQVYLKGIAVIDGCLVSNAYPAYTASGTLCPNTMWATMHRLGISLSGRPIGHFSHRADVKLGNDNVWRITQFRV